MPTIVFYLNCCAILGIVNATVMSLPASLFGYNASSKSISKPSGAFFGSKMSSSNPKSSPSAPSALQTNLINDTIATNGSPSSSCCFVVQNTIDVRYWGDYSTYTTVHSSRIKSLITFATQYIDTVVTTNVSTVIRTLNHTSVYVNTFWSPTIPITSNEAPGPLLTQIVLNGSLATDFGVTITSPTQFYVFSSVNIINVPAVSDKDGRPACATTSTYRAICPAQTYDNHTQSAQTQKPLYVTGINSNAERYFSSSPKNESAMTPVNLDEIQLSFSKPFVYAPPPSDQSQSTIVNENLGYVPQTLIEWMAEIPDYVSKFPGIGSCSPGGPSVNFFSHLCLPPPPVAGNNFLEHMNGEAYLTVSATVTVAGKGCFHPGACPTPAAPGATAVAATPEITPEAGRLQTAGASSMAQAQDTSSPAGNKGPSPPQSLNQPLPAPAQNPGSTPVISPETQAVNPPPSPLVNAPSAPPFEVLNQPSSARTDSSGTNLVSSSEHDGGANLPPNTPAKSPPSIQGLGAIIASAIGITQTSPAESESIGASPGPTPIPSYSISVAPSASAVVINGVTSVLPVGRPDRGLVPGILPIAVGSEQISQNAASEYVVAGHTLAPGAPPIEVQGTEVSLVPSASAVVIAGSTVALSSTHAREITVGAQIFTANSASQYVAGGQTLVPGGAAITVSGTRLSLAPSATQIEIGSSTIVLGHNFTPSPPPPLLTLGSHTYTANSKSQYTIAGQTLIPGGPAVTVSGTRLSLAPSATQVVVGSSTIQLGPVFTPPPLTFGSQTFTADSASDYIIDGQTLIPGAPAITISGTPISLAPSATQAIIGSSTIDLSPTITTTPHSLTFGSQTFTADSASDYIIDGQTLIPGAPAITISNTRISLAPDASEAVIGGSTETLLSGPTLPPIVIGSQTFTANEAGAYVIGSQTVTPGASGIVVPASLLGAGASLSVYTVAGQVFTANSTAFSIDGTTISVGGPGVTISGTPISLQASGILDIGNSTITLSSANSTSGPQLAAFTGKGDYGAIISLYCVLASALGLLMITAV